LPRQRVVLLIGLPASGKSTFVAGKKGVLSSDALRATLRDDETDQSIHVHVFRFLRELLKTRLQLGAPETFIDATNLTRAFRRPFIRIGRRAGASVHAAFFDTPLEECLRRNTLRERVVPATAIEAMSSRMQPPAFDEGFDGITAIATTGERTTRRRPVSA